jgi:hypothetical protein
MEVPTPPPGLTYNEFRTWRKEQGIRSTREDLAIAWAEYNTSTARKSSNTSPKARSPRRSPRKSPKSPVRYAGLSSASIVGLPGDVGRILGSQLGKTAIIAMRKASKGTSKITDEHMLELCSIPVTISEVLKIIDTLPLPIGIATIDNEGETTDRYLVDNVKPSNKLHVTIPKHAVIRLTAAQKHDEEIELSPPTLKLVLEHRLSCSKPLPNLPTRLARLELFRQVRNLLETHDVTPLTNMYGNALNLIIKGNKPVEVLFPRGRRIHHYTPEKIRSYMGQIMNKLHNRVNWMGVTNEPLPDMDWKVLTDAEAQDAYRAIVNDEVNRIRVLYRSL